MIHKLNTFFQKIHHRILLVIEVIGDKCHRKAQMFVGKANHLLNMKSVLHELASWKQQMAKVRRSHEKWTEFIHNDTSIHVSPTNRQLIYSWGLHNNITALLNFDLPTINMQLLYNKCLYCTSSVKLENFENDTNAQLLLLMPGCQGSPLFFQTSLTQKARSWHGRTGPIFSLLTAKTFCESIQKK